MADQRRNARQGTQNGASDMEPAEGSRENLNDQTSTAREQMGDRPAGGISNRSLDEEEQEQDEVPPRGQRKDEGDDAE